jgi:hypothetical protein
MGSEDYKETDMNALNTPVACAPMAEDSRDSRDSGDESANAAPATGLLLWSIAALMETLVLVGGLFWIMRGPAAVGTGGRVVLVALAAVFGGGAFAFAAARKSL